MDNQCSETAEKKRLREMTKEEVSRLSKEEFELAFKRDRLFTVRDAIAWLSKQNPDAGLMYFEINSNAWCDMSPDMFCDYIGPLAHPGDDLVFIFSGFGLGIEFFD